MTLPSQEKPQEHTDYKMKEELSTLNSSNLSLPLSSGAAEKIIRTIPKAIPNLAGKEGDIHAREDITTFVSWSIHSADNFPH